MVSRRQFLRGDVAGRRPPIRPPWALAEADFIGRCCRCRDCLDACASRIIVRGDGGFPEIDFGRGECTFCADCAAACQPAALSRRADTFPWQLHVDMADTCLAQQGVVCRTCAEQCERGALRFRLVVGGAGLPEFSAESCTGCGACVAPCPAAAIRLLPLANQEDRS